VGAGTGGGGRMGDGWTARGGRRGAGAIRGGAAVWRRFFFFGGGMATGQRPYNRHGALPVLNKLHAYRSRQVHKARSEELRARGYDWPGIPRDAATLAEAELRGVRYGKAVRLPWFQTPGCSGAIRQPARRCTVEHGYERKRPARTTQCGTSLSQKSKMTVRRTNGRHDNCRVQTIEGRSRAARRRRTHSRYFF